MVVQQKGTAIIDVALAHVDLLRVEKKKQARKRKRTSLLSEFVAHHMCASIAIVRIIMKMRSENCCRPYEEGGKSYMGEENLKLSRSKINFYIGDVRAFLKRMSDMALGLL